MSFNFSSLQILRILNHKKYIDEEEIKKTNEIETIETENEIEKIKNIHKEEINDDIQDCKCKNCNSEEIYTDFQKGEIICSNCGFVIDSHCADQGQDWRAYNSDDFEKKSRTGSPRNILNWDKGLSTVISNVEKDCFGNLIDMRSQNKMKRLQQTNIRNTTVDRESSNFKKAVEILKTYSDIFNLNKSIQENIAYKYIKLVKKENMRGKVIKLMVIALISIVCQIEHEPKPLKTIIEKSDITEKELNKYRRKVKKLLNIKTISISPIDYINQISNKLNIHGEILETSILIIKKAHARSNKSIIFGKDPKGLAAGSIYLANTLHKGNLTQKQIGKSVNITEVTVRSRYKELIQLIVDDNNTNADKYFR